MHLLLPVFFFLLTNLVVYYQHMELLTSGISLVMERKDSRRIIIASAAALLLLLLLIRYGIASGNSWNGGALILATLGSFLGGINLALAYTHMRLHRDASKPDDLLGKIRWIQSILVVEGAILGIAFFSLLLGFLGFSSMLVSLPNQGQEVGHIGLIILLIATCTLARKVAAPNVC